MNGWTVKNKYLSLRFWSYIVYLYMFWKQSCGVFNIDMNLQIPFILKIYDLIFQTKYVGWSKLLSVYIINKTKIAIFGDSRVCIYKSNTSKIELLNKNTRLGVCF